MSPQKIRAVLAWDPTVPSLVRDIDPRPSRLSRLLDCRTEDLVEIDSWNGTGCVYCAFASQYEFDGRYSYTDTAHDNMFRTVQTTGEACWGTIVVIKFVGGRKVSMSPDEAEEVTLVLERRMPPSKDAIANGPLGEEAA